MQASHSPPMILGLVPAPHHDIVNQFSLDEMRQARRHSDPFSNRSDFAVPTPIRAYRGASLVPSQQHQPSSQSPPFNRVPQDDMLVVSDQPGMTRTASQRSNSSQTGSMGRRVSFRTNSDSDSDNERSIIKPGTPRSGAHHNAATSAVIPNPHRSTVQLPDSPPLSPNSPSISPSTSPPVSPSSQPLANNSHGVTNAKSAAKDVNDLPSNGNNSNSNPDKTALSRQHSSSSSGSDSPAQESTSMLPPPPPHFTFNPPPPVRTTPKRPVPMLDLKSASNTNTNTNTNTHQATIELAAPSQPQQSDVLKASLRKRSISDMNLAAKRESLKAILKSPVNHSASEVGGPMSARAQSHPALSFRDGMETPRLSGLKRTISKHLKRFQKDGDGPATPRPLSARSQPKEPKQNANDVNIEDLQAALGIEIKKDKKDHSRNIRKAACYMVDAFNGRLQNGLGSTFDKPVYVRMAFKIHMSPRFKDMLKVLSVALCLLVFWEPASFRRAAEYPQTKTLAVRLVELFLVVLLLSDYMLRMLYMGWTNIAQKYFIKVLMFVELFCLVDVVAALGAGVHAVRASRVLRPAVFILVDKNSLVLSRQCIAAERKLRPLALMLLLLIFLVGVLANSLCSTKNLLHQMDVDPSTRLSNTWGQAWRPFQSISYAVLPLVAIVAGEGYLDVIQPYVERSPELIVLFYVLILMGMYVLLNLAMAVQVDEFQRLQTKSTKKEEKKLMKTLTVSFYLARDEGTLRLSKPSFHLLLKAYKPKMSSAIIESLFQLVDTNDTLDLDLEEFLTVCDKLRSSEMLTETTDGNKWVHLVKSRSTKFINDSRHTLARATDSLLGRFRDRLFTAIKSYHFAMATNLLLGANILMLACISDSSNERELRARVMWCDVGFIVLSVMDAVLLTAAHGWDTFKHAGWNRYHLFSLGFTALIFILQPVIKIYLHSRLGIVHADLAMHKIAAVIRAFRIFKGQPQFAMYVMIVKRLVPVVMDFSKIIVCFMYMHGIVCMEVLWQSTAYSTAQYAVYTQLSLLQVDNFQATTYQIWQEVGEWEQVVGALLVVGFIWYISTITLSQLMAVIYDVFKVFKNQLDDKKKTSLQKDEAPPDSARRKSINTVELKEKKSRHWRHQILDKNEGQKIRNELVDTVGYPRKSLQPTESRMTMRTVAEHRDMSSDALATPRDPNAEPNFDQQDTAEPTTTTTMTIQQ